MVDRNHTLSISRQARALGISRGSVYYLPRATSAADLALMRRIDELHRLSLRRRRLVLSAGVVVEAFDHA